MPNDISEEMTISQNTKRVAEALLDLGVIRFSVDDPFTWVSGIRSPIYSDNRIINSDVEVRNLVKKIAAEYIKENFSEVDSIAGVATGGLPMGALIADQLDLPFIYVRQKPKEHGMKKQVEGKFNEGDKIIVIEDHISTGGSSLKAIEGLRNANLDVQCLLSIMTYGFEIASKRFQEHKVPHYALCNLDVALSVAQERGSLSPADKESILSFRKDPQSWYKG